MQHYLGQAFTDVAKPASSANITVRIAGTSNNATIYSDDGITAKSNPFVADSLCHYDFYAASGKYDITISGTQVTTYTLPNQVIFDPFEQTAADTGMVVKSITGPLTGNVTGSLTGNVTGNLTGNVTGSLISGSANPAATGLVRATSSDLALKFRNNANSADIIGLQKNASDVVQIGDVAGAASIGGFTVPTGQVLAADQITPLNSSGIGGFWSATINAGDSAPQGLVVSNNNVHVWMFILPFKVQIGKLSYAVTTQAAASTGDAGIYDMSGNRLLYTGGFSTATVGSFSVAVVGGPITLNAGVYYFAHTCSNNSVASNCYQGFQGATFTASGTKGAGTAANNATAGVLPATLGVVATSPVVPPMAIWFER